MLRDRLRSIQVVGLLVGIVGVGVAAGIGAGDLTGSSLAGGLAAVLAGACYGLSFTWSKRHLMAIPPMVAAAGQLTAATILLAPFAITTTAMEGADITWRRIGAILLLGVVGTGVAYVLNFRIIADLGPPAPRWSPTSSRSSRWRSASSCSTSRSGGGSWPAAGSSSPACSS